MIAATQLDELKILHKNHIANTFLFASKLLDQGRRINDAQAEAIHGLLHEVGATTGEEAGKDPTTMAQHAMQKLSENIADQSARSGDLLKETAAIYAEIMRLAIAYGNDTFAGLQTASRSAARVAAPTPSVSNPWMDGFMQAFEQAAELMNRGIKPMLDVAGSTAGTSGSNGKAKTSPASGKAAR